MSGLFEIRYLSTAENDLDNIFDYITKDNPSAAVSLLEKILAFKKIEKWRDELKEGNRVLIEEILDNCPDAERQRLTQLARNARNEYEAGKGVKSSKILFRYLNQISGH